MIKCKKGEGVQYDAPAHFGEYGILKFKKDQTKKVIVSYTYFLPNGGCEMGPAPVERVYIVAKGSITVSGDKNEVHVLEEGDMLYIAPGENRDVKVNNGQAAEVMVVVVP